MFNDNLSNEEARERITQRMKEVETYVLQKKLGYGDYGTVKWVFAFVILASVVLAAVLLF